MTSRGVAFFVGLGAAFSVGCSGADGPNPNEDLAGGCDIRLRACQEAVFAAAAQVRGRGNTSTPNVRTISTDEFEKELKAEAPTGTEPDTLTPTLQLLGLLESGTSAGDASTATEATSVAAYYSEDTKAVTVIDRGPSGDTYGDVFILAHEFTHALQDADVDLGAFQKKWVTSLDSNVAVKCLVEGEATVLGIAVVNVAAGAPVETYRWRDYLDGMKDQVLSELETRSSPFFYAAEVLPYPLGTNALYRDWLDHGETAITPLYEQPLLSTLDFTDPYGLPSQSAVEAMDCHPTLAPAGFTGMDHDSLGIVGPVTIGIRSGLTGADAFGASLDWRNDSMVVFQKDGAADTLAVAWRIRFASAGAATQFAGRAPGALPESATVQTLGSEVLILDSTDPSVPSTWPSSDHCGTADELPVRAESQQTMTSAWARGKHALYGTP